MDDLEWAAWNVNKWPEGDDRINVTQIQKIDGSSMRVQTPMHFDFNGSTTVISYDQWQQKCLELQNKPDWADVPDGFDWIAQDEGGMWHAYDHRPDVGHEEWLVMGRAAFACKEMSDGVVLGSWRDTLEQRPQEHKELSDNLITTGLDRCHTVTTMINELLGDHPAIRAAGMQDKVDDMIIALSEVHQAVGALKDES